MKKKDLIIITLLFLIIIPNCKSQSINKDDVDIAYYNVINQIVLQDTIITDVQKKMNIYNLESGKYSKEQIENYMVRYKEDYSFVFLEQFNHWILSKINKDIAKDGSMVAYFGKDKLSKIVVDFPNEEVLNKLYLDSFIKIAEKGHCIGHSFSSPVITDDKMIIYHSNSKGFNNGTFEILVYSIKNPNKPIWINSFYQSMA